MNNVLQLKGQFNKRKNTPQFGPVNLPVGKMVTEAHIGELCEQLKKVEVYWQKNQVIGGALVSVHYNHVVAKSNRLKILLGEKSKSPNESIRGAKFVWEPEGNAGTLRQKHVFTHFVSMSAVRDAINQLEKVRNIVHTVFHGQITDKDIEKVHKGIYSDKIDSKTAFAKAIVDAYFVERFDVDREVRDIREESIVTIYKTGIDTPALLRQFGIDMINAQMIDDTTLRLNPDEIRILQEKAPYLIAMDVRDLAEITREDILPLSREEDFTPLSIPAPQSEPVIGVLDTQFDDRVYFHEWVEDHNMLDPDIPIDSDDKRHGTAVSSIIVDGPSFNPNLEDGCGRFRVRHFGVAKAGRFSSFTILKLIRNIVAENRDIKVWNLSLGSAMEINPNFISPEAAELDKIQSEFDVIFIVAGTNRPINAEKIMKIGAPADSLNSLVVNAVDFHGKSASYTRRGPVLSFFHKPDVSYYGGDGPDKIIVCEPLGKASVTGTSYAAPWIARKMAYLIHMMGLSRELAKALLIDSAAGWKRKDDGSHMVGYGIVPKKIEEILRSRDDEIRFVMSGTIEEYETYTYSIPVPQNMGMHPYLAKATLVYFPKSDRNQGVDYTSTEMDIHFGRAIEKDGKVSIKSIDANTQAEDGIQVVYEEDARKLYRKWDNVKHISETLKESARPRKVYGAGLWGLSIKTKERLDTKAGRGLRFGVVVTLREMNGVNRIKEFMNLCMVRNWLVNELDIDQQFDIYNRGEEDIDFE